MADLKLHPSFPQLFQTDSSSTELISLFFLGFFASFILQLKNHKCLKWKTGANCQVVFSIFTFAPKFWPQNLWWCCKYELQILSGQIQDMIKKSPTLALALTGFTASIQLREFRTWESSCNMWILPQWTFQIFFLRILENILSGAIYYSRLSFSLSNFYCFLVTRLIW